MIINNITTDSKNSVKKVYFAGPLFCKGEKEFNLRIATVLKEKGYSVFLPQRDGYEAAVLSDKTEQQKCDLIFNKDINEIEKADIIVMNLDGRVPDDGRVLNSAMLMQKVKSVMVLKRMSGL